MDSVLEEIAEVSLKSLSKSGEEDYAKALYSLIDIVSVAAAGYRVDSRVKSLIEGIGGLGFGEHLVFGDWERRTDMLKSVVVNSFSAHVLELDDWLSEGFLHPGSSIIPSVLAVGFSDDMALKDALKAIILAYELAARYGYLLGRRHYHYWHTTSTAGGMAVGSVLAWMRGGGAEEMAGAALTAASYSAGVLPVISKNASSKPLSPAHASFTGFLSSIVPYRHYGGSRTSIDLEKTLCRVLRGECSYKKSLNPPWELAIRRVGYKVFPSCRNSHTSIQAALKARETVDPQEIVGVELEVFDEAYQVADIIHPLTVDEARFSLTFLVALALVQGWPGLGTIKSGLRDPVVRKIESLVKVRVRDDFTECFPEKQPVRLIVKLRGGSRLEFYEDTPLGDPGKPLSEKDLYKKEIKLAEYSGDSYLPVFLEKALGRNYAISIRELFGRG